MITSWGSYKEWWFNIQKSVNAFHHISRMNKKNHTFISIEAGKIFDKIQKPFLVKTKKIQGIEGNFLKSINVINENPQANIIPKRERINICSLRL